MLLQVVVVPVALVTERALDWIVTENYQSMMTVCMTVFLPKVDIQDVSLMFSLGCEFLPAVFTGVNLYRRWLQALALAQT